jgi:hypothetical protein
MNHKLKLVEDEKVGQGLTEGSNLAFNHNYFPIAVAETGASAALVSDPPRAINSLRDLSLLQVQDTLTILHKLAPSYRQLMPFRPGSN